MTPAELDALIQQRVDEALTKAAPALAARDAKIAELTKRLHELEARPDPGQAPFRGVSAVTAETPDAERPSAFRGPGGVERDESDRQEHRGGF